MMFRLVLALALVFGTATSACAAKTKSLKKVPSGLSRVESAAEDAYDHALAGDHTRLSRSVATAAAGWKRFRATAKKDGASASTLAKMDSAVASLVAANAAAKGERPKLARVANAVSESMEALYALYSPTVPPAILTLDYLGREVVLDAQMSDLKAAAGHVSALDAKWGSVRKAVLDAGGKAAAAAYGASLTKLHDALTAGDAATVASVANDGLELVDGLENVFEAAAGDPPD